MTDYVTLPLDGLLWVVLALGVLMGVVLAQAVADVRYWLWTRRAHRIRVERRPPS